MPLCFFFFSVYTEDIFGCAQSSDRRFRHEQKQERKRVLQPRCRGLDVHGAEAIPESKTNRLGGTGDRLVSVTAFIHIQSIDEKKFKVEKSRYRSIKAVNVPHSDTSLLKIHYLRSFCSSALLMTKSLNAMSPSRS